MSFFLIFEYIYNKISREIYYNINVMAAVIFGLLGVIQDFHFLMWMDE